MAKLLDELHGRPLLWLDDTDYAARLLAGGAIPWLDPAGYVAFRRKAIGLLRPDVLTVPFAGFARAWVTAHPDLAAAMTAKKRAVAPARTLLAEKGLRAHVSETLRALRGAIPAPPLVLAMPSPRAWVLDAYRIAFGDDATVEVGEDEADSCAVHVADLLRAFGDCGIDALLLEEHEGHEPASSAEIAWYQPVLNVAAHYRWDLGLRLPSGAGCSGAPEGGVAFVISPRPIDGAHHGLALGDDFWSGTPAPPTPTEGFRFAMIPAGAVPETVLERLASLR